MANSKAFGNAEGVRSRIRRLAGIRYRTDDIRHGMLYLLVILLLIGACFSVTRKELAVIDYPEEQSTEIYARQLDAFMKGQLELDLEVDPRLAQLDNPYDPAARKAAGARYLWDYALYDGKYYSYFGIAPVIVLYAPMQAIFGCLPNIALACLILAVAAVIATALAYREVVLRFIKAPSLWLLLFGLAGVTSASGIYLGVLCSDMYYVAVLSAQVFSMLFVYLSVRAMRERKLWRRMLMLIVAAIALTLTVWSRPTVAVMCIAVLPLFIEFILSIRRKTLRDGLMTIASFAVPLLIGAGAVMVYNYLRFGSVLDFGAKYQLTVSDISLNTLDLDYLFSAFFSYFLCPMWHTEIFPYIEMQRVTVLPKGARYIYTDRSCGVFAYGLPLGILAYPRVVRLARERGERDRAKSALVILTVILAIVIAFADFCLGGVNMRYIYDISVIFVIVSTAILIELTERSEGAARLITGIMTLILCASSVWAGIGTVTTIAGVI